MSGRARSRPARLVTGSFSRRLPDIGLRIVGVEQPFGVPLVDQETGEVLDRDLVGSVDLLERDAEGLVVVDLKTAARKYSDLQVEALLQLSVYSYATTIAGFANQ